MDPQTRKRPEERTPPLSPNTFAKHRSSIHALSEQAPSTQHSVDAERDFKARNPNNLTIWTSDKQAVPQIMSAPVDGPSRQLPLPNNGNMSGPMRRPSHSHVPSYHPYSTPARPAPYNPPTSVRNQHPSRSPPHSAHPMNSHHPPYFSLMPKSQFLGIFEHLYDANNLVGTLKDQVRKSTSLLQTLQGSGQMIEGLVRTQVREMQNEYAEKFGKALSEVNSRLKALEEKVGLTTHTEGKAGIPIESAVFEQVFSRLEKLEKGSSTQVSQSI